VTQFTLSQIELDHKQRNAKDNNNLPQNVNRQLAAYQTLGLKGKMWRYRRDINLMQQ